jgi:hypothetical protein
MKTKKATIYFTGAGISILLFLLLVIGSQSAHCQIPAFPGAEGFGANASGGRGGQVIYVTNTNLTGPGSFHEALNTPGAKYILFQCSGVIDGAVDIPVGSHDITIAGQTSPHGIIVRGLRCYEEFGPSGTNFIIRHIRSRAGNTTYYPTSNEVTSDGFTLGGVHNAIVDHCSAGHQEDEAFDISRSSSISVQNCLFGETLGGHGYLGGMLTNYNLSTSRLDSLSIHHNIWNRIGGRFPEFSCESADCDGHRMHAEVSNNLFYHHGATTSYTGSLTQGSGGPFTYYIDVNFVNNYCYDPVSYTNAMFEHGFLDIAVNNLYTSGNMMNLYPSNSDYDLFYCCNDFPTNIPNTDMGVANQLAARHNFPSINYTPTTELLNYMSTNAGAFPRDPMDTRLMNHVANLTFDPLNWDTTSTTDALNIPFSTADFPTDSDLDGMPDYWELNQGLNPGVQDHNGTNLSMSITGINGYTNLDCYLNCLADAIVNGSSPACQIPVGLNDQINPVFKIYPNPVIDNLTIDFISIPNQPIEIFDALGKRVMIEQAMEAKVTLDVNHLSAGMYYIKVGNFTKPIIKQ